MHIDQLRRIDDCGNCLVDNRRTARLSSYLLCGGIILEQRCTLSAAGCGAFAAAVVSTIWAPAIAFAGVTKTGLADRLVVAVGTDTPRCKWQAIHDRQRQYRKRDGRANLAAHQTD
jgi:hypothetical protein